MRFRAHQVAVSPVAEWSGHLQIAEVMIGRVFIYKCEPAQPDRGKRQWAEAEEDPRATPGSSGSLSVLGELQLQAVDACVLPAWHEAREIVWIGEKREHLFGREGNPLLRSERKSSLPGAPAGGHIFALDRNAHASLSYRASASVARLELTRCRLRFHICVTFFNGRDRRQAFCSWDGLIHKE